MRIAPFPVARPAPANPCPIPFYSDQIPAGFPSPAEDHLDGTLDLNDYLIRRPASTFLVRVAGDSMIGAGILDGDILVVDRSLDARPGDIVVALLDGAFTVKRLQRRGGRPLLCAENPAYAPIAPGPEQDLMMWGVVTGSIRRFAR